ncbi:MAG: sulfite exporter TauE/SafE family protein [Gammaproteobacteria bacterium]|nr:sulfite exporter TauE/SafE family protein [Gammaproteobacteria bacterium]
MEGLLFISGASLLLGMFAGLMAGLFGIGGGLIVVPILVFLFKAQGLPSHLIMLMAIATSLGTIIPTGFVSTFAHHRFGAVVWEKVKRLAAGILLGAAMGAWIAHMITPVLLRNLFIAYLLYVGIYMAVGKTPKPGTARVSPLIDAIVSLLIGLISALLGIGGGTMTVPYLVHSRYSMHNAVAIASACGLPIAIAGTVSYMIWGMQAVGLPQWSAGYVYIPSFIAVSLGGVLTAPLGARLAHKLPAHKLKRYFSVLIFIIAAKMIWY